MDQVIVGSEHILDQNVQGAADTVNALNARGLTYTGVNISGASQRRLIPSTAARWRCCPIRTC